MSGWPAVFRVLLCVALLFNGVGTAFAATRMQVADGRAAVHAQQAGQDSACHDAGMDHGTVDPGRDVPSQPDCCDGGLCACACSAMSQAVLPSMTAQPSAWTAPSAVAWLMAGHANAVLPHPVRPPIG